MKRNWIDTLIKHYMNNTGGFESFDVRREGSGRVYQGARSPLDSHPRLLFFLFHPSIYIRLFDFIFFISPVRDYRTSSPRGFGLAIHPTRVADQIMDFLSCGSIDINGGTLTMIPEFPLVSIPVLFSLILMSSPLTLVATDIDYNNPPPRRDHYRQEPTGRAAGVALLK